MHWLCTLPYPQIDPVIFQLGPIAIRWYGLAYVLGFFLGYLALHRMILRGTLHITYQQLGDVTTWIALGVLLGGRLGWWLIYHRGGPDPEPWYEPLAIWRGGMAFHGAVIGVTIALVAWAVRNRKPLWHLSDALCLVCPIGLFFGRIANFINAELVGRPTDVPWAMVFPGHSLPRHPSQLYEAFLEGILLGTCLLLAWRFWSRRFEGAITSLFLVLYGLFRFAVEFTRQPDADIGYIAFGWLTMGQLLSVMLLFAGTVLFVVLRRRPAGIELK